MVVQNSELKPDKTNGSLYSGWLRESQYVPVRDNTNLAVDFYRPTVEGKAVETPLPVIWAHDRYRRAYYKEGRLMTILDRTSWLEKILLHGYVVAAVDVRGGGASFGTREGSFSEAESKDAYDITEWLAVQPWSNGKVGMFGRSYLGTAQYLATRLAPPHLKAVFPEKALFDLYSFVCPGGVFRHDYVNWVKQVQERDCDSNNAPTFADSDRSQLNAALKVHQGHINEYEIFAQLPYRDSREPRAGSMPYLTRSPGSYVTEMSASKVAFYHLGGWLDMWPRDTILWFTNMQKTHQKLLIGPWSHKQEDEQLLLEEHLKWYDYWLKGIDNGIMNTPPVQYYVTDASAEKRWRTAPTWPIPGIAFQEFYFHTGETGTIKSSNDGWLDTKSPGQRSEYDTYKVDLSTTTGRANRWTNGYEESFGYPDMSDNDRKGLTYTTLELKRDTEVIGHPLVYLWVASSASDADFFVYLEEIEPNGFSHYVTEGTLRGSHRALHKPPFEYLGLPYHRSYRADVQNLSGEPVELSLDLHPIAKVFREGHRIRVTITSCDRDNFYSPVNTENHLVTIFRGIQYPSRIVLPIKKINEEGS